MKGGVGRWGFLFYGSGHSLGLYRNVTHTNAPFFDPSPKLGQICDEITERNIHARKIPM